MQSRPVKLTQNIKQKSERKRIHLTTKRSIVYLKLREGLELFPLPLSQDNNLTAAFLQSIIRNPYIQKHREEFYFLSGSGSKLIRYLTLIVSLLFDENSNRNKLLEESLDQVMQCIVYNPTPEIRLNPTINVSQIYNSLISSIIINYTCSDSKTLKTELVHKYLKHMLKKRSANLLEVLYSGLRAEIFSCKGCMQSNIKFENFTYFDSTTTDQNERIFPLRWKIEKFIKEDLFEEYFCTNCGIPVYLKFSHTRVILAYPKIFAVLVNETNQSELENSFMVKSLSGQEYVYKLYSCIKLSKELFFSQIKYEENSIYEFRLDDCVLLYVSEFFSPSKDSVLKMLFYYDEIGRAHV